MFFLLNPSAGDAVPESPDSPTTGATSFGDLDRAGNEEEADEDRMLERETARDKDDTMGSNSLAPDFENDFRITDMSANSETEEEYDSDLPDYPSDTDSEGPRDEDRRANAEKSKNSKLNDGETLQLRFPDFIKLLTS